MISRRKIDTFLLLCTEYAFYFFTFFLSTFLHSPGSSHFPSSAIRSKQSDRNVYCEQNVRLQIVEKKEEEK